MTVDRMLQTNELKARKSGGGGSVPTLQYILPVVHMLLSHRGGGKQHKMQDCNVKRVKTFNWVINIIVLGLFCFGPKFKKGGGGTNKSSLNDKQLFPQQSEQITDGKNGGRNG